MEILSKYEISIQHYREGKPLHYNYSLILACNSRVVFLDIFNDNIIQCNTGKCQIIGVTSYITC